MKVMITGASGQLGNDLISVLGELHDVHGLSKDKLDVCSIESCKRITTAIQPNVIIHAAAYTAVDQAENEKDQAYAVNVMGSRNIAVAAQEIGAKLCYISTDYVFSGTGTFPYNEYDKPAPQTVYGKTKLAGEQLVQSLSNHYFIVRTSWLYGKSGNNFVKSMLKKTHDSKKVRVVRDQVGTPTYTMDLCRFLLQLVETQKYGIYHASNQGECSWFEFANAIFEEYGTDKRAEPCTTEEFPRAAHRPAFSVLDNMAIRVNGFTEMPHWRTALKSFLSEYRDTIAEGNISSPF